MIKINCLERADEGLKKTDDGLKKADENHKITKNALDVIERKRLAEIEEYNKICEKQRLEYFEVCKSQINEAAKKGYCSTRCSTSISETHKKLLEKMGYKIFIEKPNAIHREYESQCYLNVSW
jgi:hypothetical protein